MPNFGGVDLTVMGDAGHNMNPFHCWAPEFKNAGVRLLDHGGDALAALGPLPSAFVDGGVDRVSVWVRVVDLLYAIPEEIRKARKVIEVQYDRNHSG